MTLPISRLRTALRGIRTRGLMNRVKTHSARVLKRVTQRIRYPRSTPTKLVLVLGTQRSGTKMMLGTIDRSPAVWAHDHRPMDPVYFMRADPAYIISPTGSMARLDEPRLARILDDSYAPQLVVHAIAESHRGDALLSQFPNAKVLWVYRDFFDVSRSALRQWGDHQKDIIRRIHARDWEQLGWRGEGIADEVAEEVSNLYRDDLSEAEGAVLFWYVRNQFFFRRGLDRHPRVMLTKYEDLVTSPVENFQQVYRFLDIPFDIRYISHVYSSSVRADQPAGLDPRIFSLASGLLGRLDGSRDTRANTLKES